MATLLQIRIACCYAQHQGKTFDDPLISVMAIGEAIDALCKAGVLDHSGYVPTITELGRAWVWLLERTPFPLATVIDPRDGQIIQPNDPTLEMEPGRDAS